MLFAFLLSVFGFYGCLDGILGRGVTLDVLILDKEYIPPRPRFSGKYLMTFTHTEIGERTRSVSAHDYDVAKIGGRVPLKFYFGKWTKRAIQEEERALYFAGVFVFCPLMAAVSAAGVILCWRD